jgi:hypothetical protein
MDHFGFSRGPCPASHKCLVFVRHPVRSCVIFTEKLKERFNTPKGCVFVFGVLAVLSTFVVGVKSTLFGIPLGIAGFFCAPQTVDLPKDEVNYVADILDRLEDVLTVHHSRNCSRLNELLHGQQQEAKKGIHALKNYLNYLKERSNIIESFKLIDLDNNGSVSPDEIRQFLDSIGGYFLLRFLTDGSDGVATSEDVVNVLFRDYDTDGDAMISLNEFVYVMMLPRYRSH